MPPVAASVSMRGCAATWRLCVIGGAFSARCSISPGDTNAVILDSSCAGLTRASIFFRKKMDCRVKPGNDGGWISAKRPLVCQMTTRNLSTGAQTREQLRCRPAIGRQAELDLRVADGDATLEAEHAVNAADVVAALFQKLLRLARFLDADFRNVRAAPVHGRPAVEAPGDVAGRQGIVSRL